MQGRWEAEPESRAAQDLIPTLEFGSDGALYGWDGCASFTGTWHGAGRVAEIRVTDEELRFCVRGKTALASVRAVVITQDDTTMQALDADARPLARLVPVVPDADAEVAAVDVDLR